MSAKPDGGQAFPYVVPQQLDGQGGVRDGGWNESGMSLRDYFAAHAPPRPVRHMQGSGKSESEIESNWCFTYADAMLAERAKP